MHQVDLDFGAATVYTVTFTPTNPIPRNGWVKIVFPSSIAVDGDASSFVQDCQTITTQSFKGEKHCHLVPEKREVWLYDIFGDQKNYASTIAVELSFKNPTTNFFGTATEADLAFQITTYAFGPDETSILEKEGYSEQSLANFIAKIKPDPTKYAYGIDTLVGYRLRPELKCLEPCLTCSDNDPAYCTSCWGSGPEGDNKLTFLQAADGRSTCKEQCDVKYTVNGWA